MKMLKKMITAGMLCAMPVLAATAQTSTLTVKLDGLADGDTVALALIDGYNLKPTFKAPVAGGKAVINFDIPGERGFYPMVNGLFTGKTIALGKGENAVMTGRVERQQEHNWIENLVVDGSPTYSLYASKRVDRNALNVKYDEYHKNPVCEKMNTVKRGTDEWKALMASDDYKKFEADEKAFFEEVERQYTAAIIGARDSWVGPFIMLTEYSYLTEQQLPQWEQFTDEVKQSFYGKITHEKIVPSSMAGKKMPDFTFTDHATKREMTLYKVLKENKYVLLDFWASWCRPCRAEIPNIKAQYEKYNAKGFGVVSISADKKEADWLKALNEEKLPWLNDRDTDAKGIADLYKVQYYPTIYLLDADGRVVEKDIRGKKLAEKLTKLFE